MLLASASPITVDLGPAVQMDPIPWSGRSERLNLILTHGTNTIPRIGENTTHPLIEFHCVSYSIDPEEYKQNTRQD